MKKPLFTVDEYRQFGHQLKSIMEWTARTRRLFSMAYPANSPLHNALVAVHDRGIFPFKTALETLAYTEHRTENFVDDFNADSREIYQHPDILPGCTAAETALLTAAKERRRFEKKREPLTPDELEVAVKFLSHVDSVCAEIIQKSGAMEKNPPPAVTALLVPFLVISNAFLAVFRTTVAIDE